MSQHRLVQVFVFIQTQSSFKSNASENNLGLPIGQQAELGAGQAGGAGDEANDQGDEVPRLLLDLSGLASNW